MSAQRGQQVSALGEAVELIRELWSKPDVTFEGEHFQLRRARIEPRPARRIPIWLGTYGPRALRLTGALADGWLPSLPGLELEQAIAMRTTVRGQHRRHLRLQAFTHTTGRGRQQRRDRRAGRRDRPRRVHLPQRDVLPARRAGTLRHRRHATRTPGNDRSPLTSAAHGWSAGATGGGVMGRADGFGLRRAALT
jgi:alkanesulfonate monooxygenase SsuD/methylene tetrahydromethanopterin reductase-like flavin-dependent oxidoreductase (luciferase family)